MLVREMSRSECEGSLADLGFGSIACARDDINENITLMYFAADHGHLYGFGTHRPKRSY